MENTNNRGCWCPELRGKTAIITGAGGARGLGKDIALELARQGVNIVLTDIAAPQQGAWQGIASVAALVEAAGAAVARFGGVDVLVNNAGAAVAADRVAVTELPFAEWNRVMGEGWDTFVKNYVPLGFAVGASEIAHMCTYLCSDMGKFISGQDIAVDGGSTWR